MELTQDVLLPILIVTIIANAAIILILLASGRLGRRKSGATAGNQMPAFEQGAMSTSYSDRTAASTWPESASTARTDVQGVPEFLAASDAASDDVGPDASEAPAETTEAVADADPPSGDTPTSTLEDGVDGLTGLPDQSIFSHLVTDEDARVARYHRPATIVVFELDGVDRLGERLGDEAADRVIAAVADTIRRLARSADHVARVGPGRFAVLLPETDEVAAINFVERVRRACDLWLEAGSIALRLAIGWAGTAGEMSMTEAQRLATDRMYAELRRGPRRGAPVAPSETTSA